MSGKKQEHKTREVEAFHRKPELLKEFLPETVDDLKEIGSEKRLLEHGKRRIRFGEKASRTSSSSDSKKIPLFNPQHAFVLVNFTHIGQRPSSQFPGFRIMGAFPSKEAATLFQQRHHSDSKLSFWCIPTHQLAVICKSSELHQNRAHNRRQIEALVQLYDEMDAKSDKDFDKNVKEQKTGKRTDSVCCRKLKVCKRLKEEAEKKKNEFNEQQESSTPINYEVMAKHIIHNQRFAAIIVLSDIRDEVVDAEEIPEPCVAVLDVFADKELAISYAKTVARNQYPKLHIDVVDMYEFLFPENIHTDKVNESYGDRMLDEIMQSRKENLSETKRYREWCRKNGYKENFISLEGKEDLSRQDEEIQRD